MSTVTAPPRAARHSASSARPGSTARPWTGTGALVRLFLRRDRVRIVGWVLAIGSTVAATVPALEATFPDAASRQARAAILANPSAVMMTGPGFGLENYTFGAMVANELSLALFVAVAIMSILLVVRNTRAEEESGRTEILRALPVGQFAPAAAALLHVALANLALALAVVAGLVGTGMETASSLAMGLATALTGLVFGAVAAVTTQVTARARSASGMAVAVLAVTFVVRGIGDVLDPLGSWLSWLSPIAWAQQTRLFVDLRWWPLVLSAALAVVLLLVAVSLAQRRDLGAGLRQERLGSSVAASALLSVPGLARRLLRGSFFGWAISLFVMGVAFGSLATSLQDMVEEVPEVGQWIGAGRGDLTTAFGAAMLAFLALGVGGFAVGAVLRLRTEEETGRVEAMLTTGASRLGWAGAWFGVVAVQAVLLLLLAGLGLGLGVGAAAGESGIIGRITVAALAYTPAVLVLAGFALALLGWLPRAASLAWAVVAWAVFVGWIGALLDLPGVLAGLSPVHHTPAVPAESASAAPLLVMSLIALVTVVAGLVGFRRRDVGA
ncbi:MAG: ABC transporter [Actinomycetales bacterium]|nr:ABC transporter [Actinomycetales bacterium]